MGSVTVSIDLNDKGFTPKINNIRRQAKQLQDGMKDVEHQTVNSMQASSAAIRVLEGGMTGNIRAAERFISMIPAIGKGLQAAFPVIGGIALAGVFVKIGEEAYKTIHTIEQLRNVTREGLLSITEGSTRGVDSLRVQNDKLEQSIALMEHKPVNSVALALDEARLRADELEGSLNRDYTAFKKLLDESKTGLLGQLIGKASGKDVQNGIDDRLANIRTLGQQQQDQLDDGNMAGAADTLAKLKQAQAEARNWERSQVAMRQGRMASPNGDMLPYSSFYGDQGQNIDTLQGFGTTVRNQQNTQKEQERNNADVETQKKLEAAAKAAEATQKAQALMLKNDELAERQQNAFNKLTINETIQFWNDRLAAFKKGSEQYIAVQDKIYAEIAKRPDLTAENKKNQAGIGKSDVEGSDLMARASQALQNMNTEAMEKALRIQQALNASTDRGAVEQRKAAAAFQEASISIGLAQGTMSRLEAAQAQAAVHTREHADALKEVNEQLQRQIDLINQTPDSKMSASDKAAAISLANQNAANRTIGINGTYAVQQAQDQAGIDNSTISGAVQKSLNTMVQDWSDMAAQLSKIIPQTMDSMNDNIVKAMTGQKTNFGQAFLQSGQGFLKTGLQGAEGMALKALHLGGAVKPDGTQNNRIYTSTVIEGAAQAGASGGGGGSSSPFDFSTFVRPFIGKMFGRKGTGSGSDSDGDGIGFDSLLQAQSQQGQGGSGGGGIVPQLIHRFWGNGGGGGGGGSDSDGDGGGFDSLFQGGFALGGDFMANHPMLVGERGPELMMPHTAGRIIPNHQLGGEVHHHHINVNVTGNSDPAAIHAAVMRAAPHIVAASVQAVHSHSKRTGR